LNKFAAGDDLEPGFFKSNCIYGFMQLVMGQNVTNNDPSFPTAENSTHKFDQLTREIPRQFK
jgi:hypothetical protein